MNQKATKNKILNNGKLYDFIIELDNAKNFQHSFDILTKVIKNFGFDGLLYTFLPAFSQNPIMKICDNYGDSYMQHYTEHNLAQFDHVIEQALLGKKDIISWYDTLNILSDDALSVVEITRKFGIHNGVSIRTFVLDGGLAMAGVSLICKKDDDYFNEVCIANIDAVKVFVDLFHHKITSKHYHQTVFLRPSLASLTDSKLAILQGLAKGKNLKSIAYQLKLNEKYVSNIASNLPKEFGCKNRDQLMYVAGMLELGEVIQIE